MLSSLCKKPPENSLSNAPHGNSSSLFGYIYLAFFSVFLFLSGDAFALNIDLAPGVSDIAGRFIEGAERMPTAIAALAYLIGMYFGTTGVLKLKSHVEAPTQTPLNAAMARFLIGGALISLPIVYEAMQTMITGGGGSEFTSDDAFTGANLMSSLFGQFSSILGDIGLTRDVNAVLGLILSSIESIPNFITALAYLLAMFMGVMGLIKLKDHIEDPDRNPLKEAFVRLFIGALLFSLPTVYDVMARTIGGEQGGIIQIITSLIPPVAFLESAFNQDRSCTQDILSGALDSMTFGLGGDLIGSKKPSVGTAICQAYGHAIAIPAFLSAISKLFGFILGFAALMKLRDHMMNPQQTPLSQAIMRFVAGGAFLSVDAIVTVISSSVTPIAAQADGIIDGAHTGYNSKVADGDCDTSPDWSINGAVDDVIDAATDFFTGGGGESQNAAAKKAEHMGKDIYCAVTDIFGPLHSALSFVCFCAGFMFIMVGISRLLKSEQDGPKAPLGIGTIFTFIVGAMLMSVNEFIRIVSMNIFNSGTIQTKAKLSYTSGMSTAELAEFYATVSGLLKFMMMIGLISFARGLFIIRGVAEGNQQSSIMAGMTHIIAGALALNLGPFLNLIQATLGITGYGLTFE